jgi:PAS domain S-box-containing protein
VRDRTDPEHVQYLDEGGIHSMVVAPAKVGAHVVGMVALTRDAPGRPYHRADAELVEAGAEVVGRAIARARLDSEAIGRRRALVAAVSELLDGDGASVNDALMRGPICEIVCDTSARIIAANPAAGRLLGTTARALAGQRLHDVVVPAHRGALDDTVTRLLRGEFEHADRRLDLQTHVGLSASTTVRFAAVRDLSAHPRAVVVIAHHTCPHEMPAGWNPTAGPSGF